MSYCDNKKCKEYKRTSTSDYCRTCGGKLRKVACKYCSHEIVVVEDRFCGFCGRPTDDAVVI